MIEPYAPAHRGALAELMATVWGHAQDEADLAWWHESAWTRTYVVADGDRLVGAVGMSLLPMLHGGEEVLVGIPARVATHPDVRGTGLFGKMQRESERRAEEEGATLLLTVPNAASAPIFLDRLGWSAYPPLRLRVAPLPRRPQAPVVDALRAVAPREGGVVRSEEYLRWRFGGPRRYTLRQDERGYAAIGRRGPGNVVLATAGDAPLPGAAVALPPVAGVPTPKTFTLLGRSLGTPLPPRPVFELGDLDFL
jgi:GNAT superfamily N-acetyltransferase